MSVIRYYWILKNGRVTAYNVSELLRENQEEVRGGGGGKISQPTPPRLEFTLKF